MSEERGRISLRTGPKRKARPTISAPRQISSPIQNVAGLQGGTLVPSEPVPRPRVRPPPSAGTKTQDLVKRRYSTRIAQLPADFDPTAPPVPEIPSLAKFEAREQRLPPSRGGAAPILDANALRDPNLSADQYVTSMLSDASDEQIDEFADALRKLKARAAADLQQNLQQNRSQFMTISKGAERLKAEMRGLRNLMAELKMNTPSSAPPEQNDDPTSISGQATTPLGLSKRDKRSSVADRSALWNSQMQALYKNVEGSQKHLPNATGRHVVQNAGLWIELDNATYKSRRAMQIFLLNDHLLIASRKKRKADAPGSESRGPLSKLVADRCWPLLDVEVVDMQGTGESSGGRNKLADAIMVRGGGQETFIYRTEKPEDPEKKSLLLNVRKAIEELRKGLQSETDASNKAREAINYFASRDPGLLGKTELLQSLPDHKDTLIEVDGKQQNLRWVNRQVDELDIDIALQRFEPAVARVEKLKAIARGLKNNTVAKAMTTHQVDKPCRKLVGMIMRDLETTHGEMSKTRVNVSWLTRLGAEDGAREAYLAARSDTILKRARQCVFQGDLHLYIWQISFVYFTIIHNTVQCFQACFPPPMMSTCVKWAKEQVDAFNAILARQLSSTPRGGPVWMQCVERAKTHAGVLAGVGLDFVYLVGKDVMEEEGGGGGPVGLGVSRG